MNKAIILALKQGNYNYNHDEKDVLKPKLTFLRTDYEIHKKYKVPMVRALYTDKNGLEYGSWCVMEPLIKRRRSDFMLDPEFWQALGRALKWDGFICSMCLEPCELNPAFLADSLCHQEPVYEVWLAKATHYFRCTLRGYPEEVIEKEIIGE